MPYYFRVEAVNLAHILHDTNDLSTRRAGGYMLLEAIHAIKKRSPALKAISLGASIGLFELVEGKTPESARKQINEVLAEPLYALATLIVTEHNDSGSTWPEPVEAMLAQTRWQQMQSLSFDTCFYPATEDGASVKPDNGVRELSDHLDGKRPAILRAHYSTGEDDKPYSHSVHLRREEGRRLRRDFYGRELELNGADKDLVFTNSFEELAGFPSEKSARTPYLSLPKNLHNKIALFYADGNSFSKLVMACASAKELTDFDEQNIAFRRCFLRQLVEKVRSHPLGWSTTTVRDANNRPETVPALRLETLMWGGDEFLFVVPAWLALELAQLFFQAMQSLQWKGNSLTFSSALVIAHHNAPIARLEALAKYGIAEQGKRGDQHDRNSLNWIVLESFDHAGADLDGYWQARGLPGIGWSHMALGPSQLTVLVDKGDAIKKSLPRASLYRALHILRQWSALYFSREFGALEPDQPIRLAAWQEDRLRRSYGNIGEAMRGVAQWSPFWANLPCAPGEWDDKWPPPLCEEGAMPIQSETGAEEIHRHLAAWLLMSELWEYLPSVVASTANEPTEEEMQ